MSTAKSDGKQEGAQPSMGNAIAGVTSILAIPYGYTATLWSAGAITATRSGPPSTLDVLLFVIGAAVAFVVLAGAGSGHLEAEVPMRVPSLVVVNLFPILVALFVIAFPARMVGRPWPISQTASWRPHLHPVPGGTDPGGQGLRGCASARQAESKG